MAEYNLITLKYFSSNSEVQNRTLIIGGLIGPASVRFATGPSLFVSRRTRTTLEIDGGISSGDPVTVVVGNMGVSCRVNRSISLMGDPPVTYVDGRRVDFLSGRGSATFVCPLTSRCRNATDEIQDLSIALSEQPVLSGNRIEIPRTEIGAGVFYLNVTDCNGVAVFNACASELFNPEFVQSLHLVNLQAATPLQLNLTMVVINVCGENITLTNATTILDCNWFREQGRPKTIWNFYEAKNLVIESQIKGALLAPFAEVIARAPLSGSVAVGSLYTNSPVTLPIIAPPKCISSVCS